jgi:hypothetical protein
MMYPKEHPSLALARRREVLALKIREERDSSLFGGPMAAPPPDYKYVVGQTREQRLANWEKMLLDLDTLVTKVILS